MLSDAVIRGLRAETKPLKRADGGGLFILVMPDGGKHWRLAFRFAGKQKLLSGGPYPVVNAMVATQTLHSLGLAETTTPPREFER
jgi:hypothetical protein